MFGERYWRSTWLCFGLGIVNQVSAIGPVQIFSGSLLKIIKEETGGEFPISITAGVMIIGINGFVSAVLGAIPARYFGRMTILLWTTMLIVIFHAAIGVLFEFKYYTAMYICMQLFIMFFYVGAGNVAFIYFGEACVDQAMGVVLGGRWFTEMFMSAVKLYMIDSPLGVTYTFVIYAALNLLGFFFCLIFLKETRGLSPLELDDLYLPNRLKNNKVMS